MSLKVVESVKFGWFLMKPFLSKEIRIKIIGLMSLLIAMTLFGVYLSVANNKLEASFYNAIQAYDKAGFLHILIKITSLILIIVLNLLISFFIQSFLEISCRKWLTNFFVDKWFENKAYYQTRIQNNDIDNPDQRISQDIAEFIQMTLSLFLGALGSIVSLLSFIVVLWNLSGQFKFSIYHHTFAIPGYMVWVALLYSGICTYITFILGKSLSGLSYIREKYEAEFRYNLIRIHEYSDHIASYSGEKSEKLIIQKSFDNVVDNFKATIVQKLKVNIFNFFYFEISSLFPTLIAAGRYFAKEITLGNMMQINSAFGMVQGSGGCNLLTLSPELFDSEHSHKLS